MHAVRCHVLWPKKCSGLLLAFMALTCHSVFGHLPYTSIPPLQQQQEAAQLGQEARVSSGAELAAALANSSISFITCAALDINVIDSDFIGLAPSLPLVLERNVTIAGLVGQGPGFTPDIPILRLYARKQVKIGGSAAAPVWLTFTWVAIFTPQRDNLATAPNFVILDRSNAGSRATLVTRDMVVFVEACNPRSYRQSNIDPVVRSVVVAQAAQELPPEPIPGIILALNESTPAGGCVNTSLTRPTAPMQDRCWPYDIALYNMPVVGKEVDLEGVRRLTNYVWTMRTTFMACLRQIDISCVQTYGPVGCYAWTISNVAPLPIAAMEVGGSSSTDDGSSSSSGSSGSSSSSSSSSTVGIIVGCVVGGVVAVLAVVGAVLLLAARRRRRRERDSSGGGRACRRHADPEKGCQLAAADADADAVAAGDDNGGTGCCGLPSNRSQRQQRQQQYGAAAAAGHCDSSNDSRPCAAVDQQSGSLHPPTGRGPALACSSASAAVTAEDHAAGRLSAAADDVVSTAGPQPLLRHTSSQPLIDAASTAVGFHSPAIATASLLLAGTPVLPTDPYRPDLDLHLSVNAAAVEAVLLDAASLAAVEATDSTGAPVSPGFTTRQQALPPSSRAAAVHNVVPVKQSGSDHAAMLETSELMACVPSSCVRGGVCAAIQPTAEDAVVCDVCESVAAATQAELDPADAATSGIRVEQCFTIASAAYVSPSGTAASSNTLHLLPVVRGRGACGRVYEGVYRGQMVAVKMLLAGTAGNTAALTSAMQQEVSVLGRCSHPNVVRLIAACLDPHQPCLVMELCETSLEAAIHHIRSGGPAAAAPHLLQLKQVLNIALGICSALSYMHPTITHRDLKPANVLLNKASSESPEVKLADFGLARIRAATMPTVEPEAGTAAYCAPECFDIHNTVVTHHADLYSLGVCIWAMLTGEQPWQDFSIVAIAYKVCVKGEQLPLHHIPRNRCPYKLQHLVKALFDRDPLRRPAAEEVAKKLMLIQQTLQLR